MKLRGFPSLLALASFATVATVVFAFSTHAHPDLQRLPTRTDETVVLMLSKVQTIPSRPNPDGYERDCDQGKGCVFGHAWSDVDHNGCDTRNDVLAKQLSSVVFRPGTHQCVVVAGELRDPYTGALIKFEKAHASAVQIDHIFPLSLAWDMGANTWSQDRRTEFANDQANLLAVDGPANMAKGDSGPAEWMPINATFRCEYLKKFLTVALGYGLPITRADADSIRHTATRCT
jgi:hypothetical protein